MNRKKFLIQTIFGALGLIIAPKLLKEDKGLMFDGVNQSLKINDKYKDFDFSNIECFYDFTNDKYSVKDNHGNIVGWKDISGNNHHAMLMTNNPTYPYKKFAISKNMNETWTDDFAKRMLKNK